MIDSYNFGHIVVDKISYDKDVIVFPDRVQADWWRKEGHQLQLEDIQDALEEAQPNALVVGMGNSGIMQVSKEVKTYLEERNIKLFAESTEKATKIYNRLILMEDKVLGAFHLTC